ncbi:MAG: hydroxymethylbilane synthase, partial [Dermatophilaceae bacterium]|nr:hydroxymethylbilane synthase [Dermatophilaceae bacterium]
MSMLRLGTRRSALATTQSSWVADQLRALGHEVELVEVSTEGDRDQTTPLA